MPLFRFGTDGEISLDEGENRFLASNAPRGEPLPNVCEAVLESLQEPIEFPSLDRIVLPDDTVAIALQPGIPSAEELVAGVVGSVMKAGVPPELITIVRTSDDVTISDETLLAAVESNLAESNLGSRLTVVRHDPIDREQLSFLGASKAGDAIYINRHLADAAVALPIGMLSFGQNVHDSWYPTFADQESMDRVQKPGNDGSSETLGEADLDEADAEDSDSLENSDVIEESDALDMLEEIEATEESDGQALAEEVAWLLGVQFVVQLIPGSSNQGMYVLSGLPKAVGKKGGELLQQTWGVEVDAEVGLVIAGIGGGAEQQTWENVAKALFQLLPAVETDGAIAICSELAAKPSRALRRLSESDLDSVDFDAGGDSLSRTQTAAGAQLARALQQVRVYLLSQLNEEDIDNTGIAHVSDAREISKLATQFNSCLIVQDAQYISIKRNQPVDH